MCKYRYYTLFNLFLKREVKQQGFTLIELLVVVIIVGIISALSLPSMLNQAKKAREASAINNVGAVNRAQQAYRLEHLRFANSTVNLIINVSAVNDSYNYSFGTTNASLAEFVATPSNNELRAFTGCVTASSSTTTTTRIEAVAPGNAPLNC